MSVNYRSYGKIEAPKLELEIAIGFFLMRSNLIKQKIDSLDMKLSSITSNKPSPYSENTNYDIMKWTLQ